MSVNLEKSAPSAELGTRVRSELLSILAIAGLIVVAYAYWPAAPSKADTLALSGQQAQRQEELKELQPEQPYPAGFEQPH